VAVPCLAEFMPGRIYVSGQFHQGCAEGADRLYEFDPATGASRLIQEVPSTFCGGLNGLAFSPDGERLRGGNFFRNEVLEFDGDGNVSAPLGPADGLNRPNDLDYNSAGDFYVMMAGGPMIRRFPADGSPAVSIPIPAIGTIGATPDGSVYLGRVANNRIYRYNPDGSGGLFATLPSGQIRGLAVDASENVVVTTTSGIHRYLNGDPAQYEFVSPFVGLSAKLSPDGQTLYTLRHTDLGLLFYGVELLGGQSNYLGAIEDFSGSLAPGGMSVYIPEPTMLMLFVVMVACLLRSNAR